MIRTIHTITYCVAPTNLLEKQTFLELYNHHSLGLYTKVLFTMAYSHMWF